MWVMVICRWSQRPCVCRPYFHFLRQDLCTPLSFLVARPLILDKRKKTLSMLRTCMVNEIETLQFLLLRLQRLFSMVLTKFVFKSFSMKIWSFYICAWMQIYLHQGDASISWDKQTMAWKLFTARGLSIDSFLEFPAEYICKGRRHGIANLPVLVLNITTKLVAIRESLHNTMIQMN